MTPTDQLVAEVGADEASSTGYEGSHRGGACQVGSSSRAASGAVEPFGARPQCAPPPEANPNRGRCSSSGEKAVGPRVVPQWLAVARARRAPRARGVLPRPAAPRVPDALLGDLPRRRRDGALQLNAADPNGTYPANLRYPRLRVARCRDAARCRRSGAARSAASRWGPRGALAELSLGLCAPPIPRNFAAPTAPPPGRSRTWPTTAGALILLPVVAAPSSGTASVELCGRGAPPSARRATSRIALLFAWQAPGATRWS